MVFSRCVPVTNSPSNNVSTNSSSTRSPAGSSANSSSNSKADQTPFGKELDQDLFWYHQGKQTADKITVDSNAGTVVYLRGNMVETFLNSSFHTREVTKTKKQELKKKTKIESLTVKPTVWSFTSPLLKPLSNFAFASRQLTLIIYHLVE